MVRKLLEKLVPCLVLPAPFLHASYRFGNGRQAYAAKTPRNRPHGLIRHVTRQVNRCRPRDSSRDAGSPPPLPAPRQTLAPRPSAHTRCPDATPVAASAARRPPRVPPPDAAATPRSTRSRSSSHRWRSRSSRAATRRSQPRLVTWYKPSSMSVLKGRAMEFKSYCVHYRASRPGAMWRAMSIRIARAQARSSMRTTPIVNCQDMSPVPPHVVCWSEKFGRYAVKPSPYAAADKRPLRRQAFALRRRR